MASVKELCAPFDRSQPGDIEAPQGAGESGRVTPPRGANAIASSVDYFFIDRVSHFYATSPICDQTVIALSSRLLGRSDIFFDANLSFFDSTQCIAMRLQIEFANIRYFQRKTSERRLVFSLAGKKALVVGIANEDSIAFGCAKAFRAQGADLAITFQNKRAEPFVRPIAEKLETDIVLPLDVREDGEFGLLFDSIRRRWGRVDICLHSIAFCPKPDLQSRVVDCSRSGFITAMDISVYSFIRMVRRAEPLMPAGGTCMTVSFFGAEKVVENYNIMGPVKAALESVTRYMAAELGPKRISVHALSPGPLKTRAASGIGHFDELMNQAAARAPTHQLATIEDVGAYAAFLASAEAANVTGGIHYIDGGYHIVG